MTPELGPNLLSLPFLTSVSGDCIIQTFLRRDQRFPHLVVLYCNFRVTRDSYIEMDKSLQMQSKYLIFYQKSPSGNAEVTISLG